MSKITSKLIDLEIGKGKQSVIYQEVLELKKEEELRRIRVSIQSDTYNFQSYARVEMFKDTKWEIIHNIHYSNMKTKSKMIHDIENQGQVYNKVLFEKNNKMKFKEDRDKLIKVIKEIIF